MRYTKGIFFFSHVSKQPMLKEVLTVDLARYRQDTSQDGKILKEIIRENADIFSDFLVSGFNHSIRISTFPSSLKQANTILDRV